jgi:hypothetical protein
MTSLVRRTPATPAVQPDQLLNAQVAEVERGGTVILSRLQAGAAVSSVALHSICTLSCAADAAFKTSPMGEEHYRAVLAAYANFAVSEIQSLSLRGVSDGRR